MGDADVDGEAEIASGPDTDPDDVLRGFQLKQPVLLPESREVVEANGPPAKSDQVLESDEDATEVLELEGMSAVVKRER